MHEDRISFTTWVTELFWPWTRPARPLTSGILILAALSTSIHFIDTTEKSFIWWTSLSLQIIGLSLSIGALMLSAVENGVISPIATVRAWLARFPAYRKGVTNKHSSFCEAKIRFNGFGIGSSQPGPDKTIEEKIEWLINTLNNLHSSTASEFQKINLLTETIAEKVETFERSTYKSQERLEEKIRGISTANFYQVACGLMLLSIGSILSLFIPVN